MRAAAANHAGGASWFVACRDRALACACASAVGDTEGIALKLRGHGSRARGNSAGHQIQKYFWAVARNFTLIA